MSATPSEQTEIALLKKEVGDLKDAVGELAKTVKTLNDSWSKANGALTVIKWLFTIVAAGGGLAALIKYMLFGRHP